MQTLASSRPVLEKFPARGPGEQARCVWRERSRIRKSEQPLALVKTQRCCAPNELGTIKGRSHDPTESRERTNPFWCDIYALNSGVMMKSFALSRFTPAASAGGLLSTYRNRRRLAIIMR